MDKVVRVLDVAADVAGAFGRFAGGVMSIGLLFVGGARMQATLCRAMESLLRAPFVLLKCLVVPFCSRSSRRE